MCYQIIINRGEIEINTVREFKEHFKSIPIICEHYKDIIEDSCLCQINISESLKNIGIKYKTYCGDYYIGDLDLIDGD